jgi:hypothetical protein
MRQAQILVSLALLFVGCTSLRYARKVTTYPDRVEEEVKVSRDSIWQEVSFAISTNGVEYNNDGGGNALDKATALLEAAGKLKP